MVAAFAYRFLIYPCSLCFVRISCEKLINKEYSHSLHFEQNLFMKDESLYSSDPTGISLVSFIKKELA